MTTISLGGLQNGVFFLMIFWDGFPYSSPGLFFQEIRWDFIGSGYGLSSPYDF